MADFLVYWKKYWKQIAKNPNATDRYWHTEKESFFNEVEKGDRLWVVVTAGKDYPGQWRLIQRINIGAKRVKPSENGPFEMEGDRDSSQLFDIDKQLDFVDVLRELAFATGKRITARRGAIGNTLQAPRKLAPPDSALLDRYSQKLLYSKPNVPESGLAEFFRQASYYRYHRWFQKDEREYKIQLHNSLAESRSLLNAGSSKWLLALEQAIESKDDNIIYWEYKNAFLEWLAREPSQAFEAVGELWSKGAKAFSSFSRSLAEMGLTRPGAQLEITSTLLLALSPNDYPPVKVKSFSKAMKIAGWDGLYTTNDAAERYSLAQSFMDAMIAECHKFNVKLRDRLDVQGVVWCVSGGWPKVPLPADWVNDPAQRAAADEWEYIKELHDIDHDPNTKDLSRTEKLVLAKARVGQGKFREDLVRYWSSCAVTRCGNLNLLRASHIKPWKYSDSRERLDPYNGLLLSANLDLAFDKGLITFEESGRIKISKQLSAHDRQVLGIHSGQQLCKMSPKHLPYLKEHRDKRFEQVKTEDDEIVSSR